MLQLPLALEANESSASAGIGLIGSPKELDRTQSLHLSIITFNCFKLSVLWTRLN